MCLCAHHRDATLLPGRPAFANLSTKHKARSTKHKRIRPLLTLFSFLALLCTALHTVLPCFTNLLDVDSILTLFFPSFFFFLFLFHLLPFSTYYFPVPYWRVTSQRAFILFSFLSPSPFPPYLSFFLVPCCSRTLSSSSLSSYFYPSLIFYLSGCMYMFRSRGGRKEGCVGSSTHPPLPQTYIFIVFLHTLKTQTQWCPKGDSKDTV